jgi:hypothetical protein
MTEQKKEWVKTFRCPDEAWTEFKALCQANGTNASQELQGFVQACLKAGKVGAIGEAESAIGAVSMADVDAAIAPLRDELAEMRELLGKSQAA